MLLERLVNEFINKTEKLLEDELLTSVPNNDSSSINSGKTGSILSSFRSALYRNSRTESVNSSTTHSTEIYSTTAPHSLSLNDLTCLATDNKKYVSFHCIFTQTYLEPCQTRKQELLAKIHCAKHEVFH